MSRPPATIKVDCLKLMWEWASAELTSQMQIICSAYCLLTLLTAFSVMVTPCKSNLVFVLSSFVRDIHLIHTGLESGMDPFSELLRQGKHTKPFSAECKLVQEFSTYNVPLLTISLKTEGRGITIFIKSWSSLFLNSLLMHDTGKPRYWTRYHSPSVLH